MNWLKRLFSGNTSPETSGAAEANSSINVSLDDQSYFANSDILEGLEFSSTLQIRTPLNVLKHHGEIFHGPPSKAPKYGSSADGIWLFKQKLFPELSEGSTHASDIGSVPPNYYLPFLIQFRSIVESNEASDDKIKMLAELPMHSANFKEIWKKLCSSYEDFPVSFFYLPFTELPGIGRQLAKRLYEAGFRTNEEIISSSTERLTNISGLGAAGAAKIKALASN